MSLRLVSTPFLLREWGFWDMIGVGEGIEGWREFFAGEGVGRK